jgi:tRNA1(Val) A37 N6-methylase TrmN6
LVACEAWIQRERVEPAGRAAGLALSYWRDVIPRQGKAPLFVVFAMTAGAQADAPVRPPPLVVRDGQGRRTPEFMVVREAMGMPA